MNSIRITKAMAETAALKMANKAYYNKIEKVQCEIDSEVEKLVKKYVPSPVIACVNEYKKYFYCVDHALITTDKVSSSGWNGREISITGHLTFNIPSYTNTVNVDRKEYAELKKLYDKKRSLVDDKNDFINKVVNALLSLKTLKKVQEQLSEAVKYIEVPNGTMLPAPVYTELNNLISEIK